jgi:uncharacterized protein with HEPN domain
MAVAAVERKLQVISEAAIRLAEEAERLFPGLPWKYFRGGRKPAPACLRNGSIQAQSGT